MYPDNPDTSVAIPRPKDHEPGTSAATDFIALGGINPLSIRHVTCSFQVAHTTTSLTSRRFGGFVFKTGLGIMLYRTLQVLLPSPFQYVSCVVLVADPYVARRRKKDKSS